MTKVREPLSIENELYSVLGDLTIERAADLTGRTVGYLRALTDPDKREILSVRDMELLDLASFAKNGKGFPLFEALGRRLKSARAERFAEAACIGRHAIDLAREHGEACSAMLEATLSAGDPKLVAEALRQTEDIVRVATEAIASMRCLLDRPQDEAAPVQPP